MNDHLGKPIDVAIMLQVIARYVKYAANKISFIGFISFTRTAIVLVADYPLCQTEGGRGDFLLGRMGERILLKEASEGALGRQRE